MSMNYRIVCLSLALHNCIICNLTIICILKVDLLWHFFRFKIAEALELYKKLVEDNGYTSLAPHLAILNSLAKEIESGLEKVKAGAEAPPTTADAAPTDAAPTGNSLS